ncbi:MAG: LamG-like jellyroll fold domain-containing protein, partial [Promethearchaeota archaeon]
YYGNDTLEFDNVYLLPYNPMGVMWQTFDEIYTHPVTFAQTIQDSSQSNDGDIVLNPVLSADAKAGNSMYFGGDSDRGYVNLGNPTDLQITGDQTIAMWVKPQQLYQRQNPYAKAYGGEGTITLETSGSFSYYYGQGGGNTSPYQGFGSGTGTASAGNWVHIAIVRDLTNGQLRWYEDGGLANQATAVYDPAFVSSLDAIIGEGYVSNFWGNIDELHIFNASLSVTEINRLRDYTYSCNAELFEEVEQGAQVEITIRDVDGLPVPNAKVSLYNSSGSIITEYSDNSGLTIFSTIDYGYYNVTVNYTLQETGDEEEVFSGEATNGFLHFTGLLEEETFYVDLWTIDFSVFDFDGDVMDYGYVEVYDSTKTTLLANLTLNQGSGTQVFRWRNDSSYYYKVYYLNEDYSLDTVLLNDTTVDRTDLAKYIPYNINETSTGDFHSTNTIYADGSNSTFINSTRLVNATIYISEIVDDLNRIDLYYISVDDEGNPIPVKMIDASKTYTDETEDTIEVQLADDFDAYGIKIDIYGTNATTQCDGKVEVNYTQTTSQRIFGNMSKISLRIVDITNKDPVPGVVVHVYNGTDVPANSLVNLTTDDDGYAYGVQNSDLEFWYLQGNYTFTLEFFDSSKNFNVTYSDPEKWMSEELVSKYNYTVVQNSSLIFEMQINIGDFKTTLFNHSLPNDVNWGDMMTFEVNFTYSTDLVEDQPVTNPDSIVCTITGSIVHPVDMTHIGGGIFQAVVDSSLFSSGTAQSMFTVEITGEKAGYLDPKPLLFLVTLNPIATKVSLHDYANGMSEITDDTITAYYNENVNLSIAYLEDLTDVKISGATLSYYWDYGAGTDVQEDPLNLGYYTIDIFTGDAPNIGKYGLYITISLENYTYQTTVAFIEILARPTVLSSTDTDETQELLRITQTLYESEEYLFNFTFSEVLGNQDFINDTDVSSFTWQYTTGDTNGQGDLILLLDGTYQLDFNTSSRAVGDYIILVTLSKSNFEQRQAMIFISIEKRNINYEFLGDFDGPSLEKVAGNALFFSVSLKDNVTGNPLLNASVIITFDDGKAPITLSDDDNDGVYTANVTYSKEEINAFFRDNTFYGTLTVNVEYYSEVEKTVIISVKMDEIFEGFPTFYLLLGAAGLAILVGSLVGYKLVQNARIPAFVKMINKVISEISGKKTISDENISVSAKEEIIEKFDEYWKLLDLNLNEILGLNKGSVPSDEILSSSEEATGGF